MLKLAQAAGAALLLLTALRGQAFEFKTVGPAPAILYDAPSLKGAKQFIAPCGMPLEVVLAYGDWVKVRDVGGALAWTPAKGLSSQHGLVVRAANLKVRTAPDDAAGVVFVADKGILLDVIEPSAAGWIKVRHQDGLTGYVKNTEVWGL